MVDQWTALEIHDRIREQLYGVDARSLPQLSDEIEGLLHNVLPFDEMRDFTAERYPEFVPAGLQHEAAGSEVPSSVSRNSTKPIFPEVAKRLDGTALRFTPGGMVDKRWENIEQSTRTQPQPPPLLQVTAPASSSRSASPRKVFDETSPVAARTSGGTYSALSPLYGLLQSASPKKSSPRNLQPPPPPNNMKIKLHPTFSSATEPATFLVSPPGGDIVGAGDDEHPTFLKSEIAADEPAVRRRLSDKIEDLLVENENYMREKQTEHAGPRASTSTDALVGEYNQKLQNLWSQAGETYNAKRDLFSPSRTSPSRREGFDEARAVLESERPYERINPRLLPAAAGHRLLDLADPDGGDLDSHSPAGARNRKSRPGDNVTVLATLLADSVRKYQPNDGSLIVDAEAMSLRIAEIEEESRALQKSIHELNEKVDVEDIGTMDGGGGAQDQQRDAAVEVE